MPRPPESAVIANRILRALPPATLDRLSPDLECLETVNGQVIDRPGAAVEHLYFVNRGLISLVMSMQDGRTVEVGAVGIEGVTDLNALFETDEAFLDTMVQIPGTVFRIRRDKLAREVARDRFLRELLQKYSRFAYRQVAQIAACNRLHSLEGRCGRWLLTAHDNARADTFPLTQEFLAIMLGVRRAGISIAAHGLKKAGLIVYARGQMTITNRSGLEKTACECYGAMRRELDKLFGTLDGDGPTSPKGA